MQRHCDIATIGNNEGMTISHEALNNLYNDAKFEVICTNVIDEEGHLPHNIATSSIKEIEGVRFLFVATTAPFTILSCVRLDCDRSFRSDER